MSMIITSGGPEHIYESETSNGEITAVIGPREEIIRCRECQKRRERPEGLRCKHFGYKDAYGNLHEPFVHPNGFCAWAERREA